MCMKLVSSIKIYENMNKCMLCAPLSTGSLYPKFRAQTSGIIQKLNETKTNTNTG